MSIPFRIDSKARQVGNSLVTTLPYSLCQALNLKENDRLVLYQFDGILVVVPLAYLGVIGEPELIRRLTETPLPQSPSAK